MPPGIDARFRSRGPSSSDTVIPPPRVVFDCMVFLQGAARRGGPAARCIDAALDGTVELLVSAEVLAEVADVLTRPELQRKFPALSDEAVREFLRLITASSTPIDPVTSYFEYPRDTKDEPYLNVAISGAATYIVSRDNDLLDLMNSNSADGQRLRNAAPRLQIVDPIAFLSILAEPRVEAPI